MNHDAISRRAVLFRGACAAGGLILGGCASRRVQVASLNPAAGGGPADGPESVVLGVYPTDQGSPAEAVRRACRRLDWSWLKRGDTVLLKLSCNSHRAHPAVTSPNAVRAVIRELLERGAGRVLAGDQGGVVHVRLAEGDRRYRSTRELAGLNGLHDAIVEAGGIPYYFDESGYEGGYFPAACGSRSHWNEPLFLTTAVRQADHIVYLPRLGTHVLAGCTHGHKLAVGWLRDDSRFALHYGADTFHEKYTEISYLPEIRDRLRLVLSLSESAFTCVGPHTGTVGRPDGWLVVASRQLAAHDAVAAAALTWLRRNTGSGVHIVPPAYGPFSNLSNWLYVSTVVPGRTGLPWGRPDPFGYRALAMHDFECGVTHDRALSRAWALQGGVPAIIRVYADGCAPAPGFRNHLESFGGGILRM